MDSFYTPEEVKKLGFRKVGSNVLISRKASIYGTEKMIIGDHVRIDDFCILSGHIEVGSYVHIAAYSALYGGEKGIFVSDFANISSRVSIYRGKRFWLFFAYKRRYGVMEYQCGNTMQKGKRQKKRSLKT